MKRVKISELEGGINFGLVFGREMRPGPARFRKRCTYVRLRQNCSGIQVDPDCHGCLVLFQIADSKMIQEQSRIRTDMKSTPGRHAGIWSPSVVYLSSAKANRMDRPGSVRGKRRR